MMRKNRQQLKKQKGLTLIELMVGIVAIGVLVFLVLSGYERFQTRADVKQHVQDLIELSTGIENAFMTVENSYANVAQASVVGARLIPSHMLRAGIPYNPWGGAMDFATATVNNANDAFTITTPNLPAEDCVRLTERLAKTFRFVVAGGVTVRDLVTTPTAANIQAGCASLNSNTVVVTYQ